MLLLQLSTSSVHNTVRHPVAVLQVFAAEVVTERAEGGTQKP
jgi:hypothetical protein